MNDILRLLPYIKPYKSAIFLNLLCNLLYVFSQFFSLALVAPFIGILFGMTEPITENPGLSLDAKVILNWCYYHVTQIQQGFGTFYALLFVAGLYVFFAFFANLTRYLATYFLTPMRNGIVRNMRNDLFIKILALPISFFSEQRKGDLISRMANDASEVDFVATKALQSIIKDFINITVFLIGLFTISAKLMLVVIIILPPTTYIINLIGRSLKRNSERLQVKFGLLVSLIEESISGLRMIKSYSIFGLMNRRFSAVNEDYTKFYNRILRRAGLSSPVTEIFVVIAAVVIIWFGGDMVMSQRLSAEVFILFIILFFRLLPPAKDFVGAIFLIQRGRAAVQRIFSILDAPNPIVERDKPLKLNALQESIIYKNVSFAYADAPENLVLNDVSFELKKGKTLAIVGTSGGGKSTLADLLPRFHDCTEGEILLDGISVKDLAINDLRAKIGIVSQHSVLFNDTIFNNITFGMPDVSLEAVENAAKIANAHEFIIATKDGYFSRLSDNGSNLSGGQRQRLSIARAVLRNPDILILDEATSALDTESEFLVQESLKTLMQSRTTLIIAHRLSTIQHADEILVLDHGIIAERGTHRQLVNANGLYSRLVALQAVV